MKHLTALIAVLILAVSIQGETIRQRVIDTTYECMVYYYFGGLISLSYEGAHGFDSVHTYYNIDTTYIEHEIIKHCDGHWYFIGDGLNHPNDVIPCPPETFDVDTCHINLRLDEPVYFYKKDGGRIRINPCLPETTIVCDTVGWFPSGFDVDGGELQPVFKCDTITGRSE